MYFISYKFYLNYSCQRHNLVTILRQTCSWIPSHFIASFGEYLALNLGFSCYFISSTSTINLGITTFLNYKLFRNQNKLKENSVKQKANILKISSISEFFCSLAPLIHNIQFYLQLWLNFKATALYLLNISSEIGYLRLL